MKVHIHGNCQAYVLGGMLGEVFPDWDITWFEVYTDEIITRNEDYRRRVAGADFVLSQPIHRGFRERDDLSLDWVRTTVRNDAMLLVFPSMHFTGHHPSDADLDLPGDPGGDAIAASLVAGDLDPDSVGAILTSPELLSRSMVRDEFALSIAEIMRREAEDRIDIRLSPLLEAAAGRAQLFHIVNYPGRIVYVFMLNAILARLGFRRRAPEAGKDWQDIPHLPPLPSVGAYLTHAGAGEAAVLLPDRAPMTQRQYYQELAARLAKHPPADLLDAVCRRVWPREFLGRFAVALGARPSPAADALAPDERRRGGARPGRRAYAPDPSQRRPWEDHGRHRRRSRNGGGRAG